MHKITNLWKFWLHRSSKLRENNGRKNTLVAQSCVLSDAWKGFRSEEFFRFKYFSKKLPLSQTLRYSRWSRFLTITYTINLSFARYQVSFYARLILSNNQKCPVLLQHRFLDKSSRGLVECMAGARAGIEYVIWTCTKRLAD